MKITPKNGQTTPAKSSSDGGEPAKKPAAKAKSDAGDGGGGDAGDGGDGGAGDKKKKPGAKEGDGDKGKKDDVKAGDDGDGEGDDGEAGDQNEGDGDGGDEGDGGGGEADDWRVQMAGGDADLLKRLERFDSPAAAGRSLKEAERLARSKGGAQPPPADAPVEQQAAYYTQHFGRPEKVEDIAVEPVLPEGEEFQDDEVTVLQGVLGTAHKAGVFGAPQLSAMAQMVADMVVGGRKELEKKASATAAATKAKLEKEWGKDFTRNMELANAYVGMRAAQANIDPAALANLKLADGSRLGDNEMWARIFAQGGRDHVEDPGMLREDTGGKGVGDLETQLKAEMAKMNGTPAEMKEYASEAAKKRRDTLRSAIKRAKGGGGKKR